MPDARRTCSAGWWLCALALLGMAAVRWVDPATWNVVDLVDFVDGGHSVIQGSDIYRYIPGVQPFNYPPFAAVVFVPMALAGEGARWVATGLSLAAGLVTTWTCFRDWSSTRSVLAARGACLILAIVALEPTQRTLIYGQVNLVLMALVMLDVFVVPRRFRGILIGVAAGIKLVPAIFVMYFLLRGEWRSASRAALTGLVTIAVGWAMAPASSMRYWVSDTDKLSRFGPVADDAGNQSLWATVVRFIGPDHSSTLLVSAVIGIATAVWAARKALRSGDHLHAVCCLAVGGLLASPISWTHHWVWVLPVLVVLARRRAWLPAISTVVVMFLPPMWLVPNDPGNGYSFGHAIVGSSYTLMALGFLLATDRLTRATGIQIDGARDPVDAEVPERTRVGDHRVSA
jgi:alpha-1,2-mannosyltransferase